jgi:hypothetical protein
MPDNIGRVLLYLPSPGAQRDRVEEDIAINVRWDLHKMDEPLGRQHDTATPNYQCGFAGHE